MTDPASLPATGRDSLPVALLGTALLVTGIAVLLAPRRRTTRSTTRIAAQ